MLRWLSGISLSQAATAQSLPAGTTQPPEHPLQLTANLAVTFTHLCQVQEDVQEAESFLQVNPELLQHGEDETLTATSAEVLSLHLHPKAAASGYCDVWHVGCRCVGRRCIVMI